MSTRILARRKLTSRKTRSCWWCSKTIEEGDTYYGVAAVIPLMGGFVYAIECVECSESYDDNK